MDNPLADRLGANPDVTRLAGLVRQARRIVVFTGAGIGTKSRIPGFRGPGAMVASGRLLALILVLLIGYWSGQPRPVHATPASDILNAFYLFQLWDSLGPFATKEHAQGGEANAQMPGEAVARISGTFQNYHLSQQPFNDRQAEQMLTHFLDQLDPGHYYFLQSDFDEFVAFQDRLYSLIRAGNIDLAIQIQARLLKRMGERESLIVRLLHGKFDLSSDDSLPLDWHPAPYAKDERESEALWAKKLKFELAALMVTGASQDQARESLLRTYRTVHLPIERLSRNSIMTRYLDAFVSTFDPHSRYLSPDELGSPSDRLRAPADGIGAAVRQDRGLTVISSIDPGGAAAREGTLKAGDAIIAVAQGREGPFEGVRNLRLIEVERLLRGERGSIVRLACLRADGSTDQVIEVVLARDHVTLTGREATGTIQERRRPDRAVPYRIGLVKLPWFYVDFAQRDAHPDTYRSSARDVKRILEQLNAQGVDGMILDLRDNPGGGLDEAVSLSGLFLDRGPILQIKTNREILTYNNPHDAAVYKGPMVVFVNRQSAAASEILAGAMKDYGRAIIVGDRSTFGQGTVQNFIKLPRSEGTLKETVAQFYRPSGGSPQIRGIESDVVLPSLDDSLDIGESFLQNPIPWGSVRKIDFKPWGDPAQFLPGLRERSLERQAASAYFRKIDAAVRKYTLTRGSRKEITLRQMFEAKKNKELMAAMPKMDKSLDASPMTQSPDPALEEAEEVLIDYVERLAKK